MRVVAIFSLADALLAAGCNLGATVEHLDDPESACQDIGFCTTESSDQIAACRREAATLRTEAAASGCGDLFDDYFACADDRLECEGNVPTFHGCEAKLAALRGCLARGEAANACGALDAALNACASAADDDAPAPCAGGSACAARCYLDNVPDVCRPIPNQLTAAIQCALRCPF